MEWSCDVFELITPLGRCVKYMVCDLCWMKRFLLLVASQYVTVCCIVVDSYCALLILCVLFPVQLKRKDVISFYIRLRESEFLLLILCALYTEGVSSLV